MGVSLTIDSNFGTSGSHSRNRNGSVGLLVHALRAELPGKHHPAGSLPSAEMAGIREQQQSLLARLVGAIDPECAEKIAARLLEQFGSLGGIFAASQLSIARTTDSDSLAALLTMAKAAVLEGMREVVRRDPFDPADGRVMTYLIGTMQGAVEEHLHAIFLDNQQRYLRDERIASGSWSQISIRLRSLLRRAIELDSAQIVLFHNHPSGVAEPSSADIDFTRQASSAAKTIGVKLLDHLIVAGPSVFSMRLAGMMP